MSEWSLLVTGKHLAGQGFRAIDPVYQELVAGAGRDIHIMAYTISLSAMPLLRQLRHALERGIAVTLVADRIENYPSEVQEELWAWARTFRHATVRNFTEEGSVLHAKVLVVDRNQAIVGSANLSFGGLAGNHEIGVLLSGDEVWRLAKVVDELAAKLGVTPNP